MINSADVCKAINSAWDASGLNAVFKSLWDVANEDDFPVLHDQEASPEQPFPYCVMDEFSARTTSRMSGSLDVKQEIRDVLVRFNIHAQEVDGDARTAKRIAADLVEEVMKVFGGHPTVSPTASMTLDNGAHLITQYQSDFCVREDEDKYLWGINYLLRLDVPVAV